MPETRKIKKVAYLQNEEINLEIFNPIINVLFIDNDNFDSFKKSPSSLE